MVRLTAIGLCVTVLLVSTLSMPSFAAGSGQNDAATGTDAGDTRAAALALPGSGRYNGQLVANTDKDDWYKFFVSTVVGASGRPLIDLVLFTDTGSDYALELWRPTDTQTATATGTGPTGMRALQFSADADSTWSIHVSGTTTGLYHLTFRLANENDANAALDAPDSTTVASNGRTVPGDPGTLTGTTFSGNLSNGDPGDLFRFHVNPAQPLFGALSYPSSQSLRLQLVRPTEPTVHLESTYDGTGFSTVYAQSPGGNAGDWWAFRVTRASGTAGWIPYELSVWTDSQDPQANLDGNSGGDAANGAAGAPAAPKGLSQGSLTTSAPADLSDVYALTALKAGQVVRVGTASYAMNPATKVQLLLTLLDSNFDAVDSRTVCAASGGITWTVPADGTWFVRVDEAAIQGSTGPCTGGVARSGNYLLFFDRDPQDDAAFKDAPSGLANAPDPPAPLLSSAWTDPGDLSDTFHLGTSPSGGVVRAAVWATDAALIQHVTVFDVDGTVVGTTQTSQNGGARLQAAVPHAGDYWLRVEQAPGTGNVGTASFYDYFGQITSNEAPTPVTLNTPASGDVGRNSVKLTWTESPDDDFQRYEVHRAQQDGFTPSGSTLAATFTSRAQTSAQISGLESGRHYQFLVRVADSAGLTGDSNRIGVDLTSGPVNNHPPTLSTGTVNPTSGDASQTFTFQITYTDQDNDPAVTHHLYIDSVPYDMSTTSTNYAAGASYTMGTTLPPGTHSFYFVFSDGDSTFPDARDPAAVPGQSSSHSGPTVTQQGNQPPVVQASASPGDGPAPLDVHFNADASDPDPGDSLSYSWDFDNSDGIQADSTQRNPTHTYDTPGQYTASVRVSDSKGATSSSSVAVNVREPTNKPPVVNPTATPSSGVAPLSVQFDAGASDPDGVVTKYSWDFDSANGIQQDSNSPKPAHTYVNAGSYVATVSATDNKGTTVNGTVEVVVRTLSNTPPNVVVHATPSSGPAPLAVQFTADAVDADGDAVTVTWDFDTSDGVTVEDSGTNVTHTYPLAGTFTAMALAKDSHGATSSGTTQVTVQSPPVGQGEAVFIRASPTTGRTPLNVSFRADTTNLSHPAASYTWRFGDDSALAHGASVNHVYSGAGTYTVDLTVMDSTGGIFDSTVTIHANAKKSPDLAAPLAVAAIVGLAAALRARRRA